MDKFDYTFTPTASSITVFVRVRNGAGLDLDFNGEIALNLYEVVDNNISLSAGSVVEESIFNNILENRTYKGELVDSYSMPSSASKGDIIKTYSGLIQGDKYHISIPYTRFYMTGCSTPPELKLNMGTMQIGGYSVPEDGYTTTRTEVEFIAEGSSMNLSLGGSGSCAQKGMNLTNIYLYKKESYTPFSSGVKIKSSELNVNFHKAKKKDVFINNYSRSTTVVPTTGSTYVTVDALYLTGLTIGKKYRLKTPEMLFLKSGSGPSATTVKLKETNTVIRQFYSSASINDGAFHVNHEFTATATTMTIEVSSRYSGGINLTYSGTIEFDVYEIIE